MKRTILSALLTAGSLTTYAQFFDYSSPTGWVTHTNTYTLPAGCAGVTIPHATVVGTVSVTGGAGGVVDYNDLGCAHENRIARPIGFGYHQQFYVDFQFEVESGNLAKAIHAYALTSLDRNIAYDVPMAVCGAAPVMDVLGVALSNPGNNPNDLRATVNVWDDGVNVSPPATTFISLNHDQIYYGRTEIYGNEHGQLQIFSDEERTELVGSFCFDIPNTVRNLTFLQHGTETRGGISRQTNAWVDNVRIERMSEDCCTIDYRGPWVICSPKQGATYNVVTDMTDVVVDIEPNDVIYTVAPDGSFTITSWGAITTAPKEVTVTVTAMCNCVEVVRTFTIFVYPHLNPYFDFSGAGTSGGFLTDFSAVSTEGMPGVVHTWNIYESDVSETPITQVRPTFTSTGTGSTFNVTAMGSPNLEAGTYYLVTHTMHFETGACDSAEFSRLLFLGTLRNFVDLGPAGTLTPREIEQRVRAAEAGGTVAPVVRISPNPTGGVVRVESDGVMSTVLLIDAHGKALGTVANATSTASIDLSDYPAGVYYLRIVSEGKTFVEKVVKD